MRIPLLRRVVAAPNTTPERRSRISWVIMAVPDWGRLLVKRRLPRKDRKAQELSAYGAERKRPAGDRMWRMPADRANPEVEELGKMTRVRWNKVKTASR